MTTAYALLRDGRIRAIKVASLDAGMAEALVDAIRSAGLKTAPQIKVGRGKEAWYKTDPDRMSPGDVVHAELWGVPAPTSPAGASRDGQLYSWSPSELPHIAEAYRLAGGQMDDHLRDLA